MPYFFSNTAPSVVIVDGSSYLFRAFHALPNLINAAGEHTGAIFGVMNMLRRLIEDYPSSELIVVFDSKEKTLRHEIYPEYKAHRPPMPPTLVTQIQVLHELITAYGLPLLVVPGIEADDIIGTLTRAATSQGLNVIISTGDKDLAQLVNEQVILIDTMTDTILDIAGVIKKFGVAPHQIVDYLSLMGDSSDNIPGIPKVGKVTAAKWINHYESLDNLVAHASEITGKIGEALREHLSQLPLSKKLTTVLCDLPLPLSLDQLKKQPIDQERITKLLLQCGFQSWLRQVDAVPKRNQDYVCIQDQTQWLAWKAKIKLAPFVAIDTETTALEPMHARLVGLSFAVGMHDAAYLPLRHDVLAIAQQLPEHFLIQELKPLLEDPQILKVGQHLKYDLEILEHEGIQLQGLLCDTMLASYVLESGLTRHDLTSLAKRHLHCDSIPYEAVTGKGAKQISFAQVSAKAATEYAAEDADLTWRLAELFMKKLDSEPQLKHVFEAEEMPLVQVLKRMEQRGVLIDAAYLKAQSEELAQDLLQLESRAFILAGTPFNLASPKQLREILFDRLGLPVISKTPTGEPSTAEDVLQEMAENFELPRILLEHRHLSKLKSTYTDRLPLDVHPTTGRVHTSYHQAGASTGRLSSSNPNLQNIPVRSEQGKRIRQAFIAKPGFVIFSVDYSQVELRIMAHLSQDKNLQSAFSHGVDVHKATASEVFGIPADQVDAEHRRKAKAINFGLIYGMSGFGLAKQLEISREEAEAYIKVYFTRYPGVKNYMERTREQAKKQGYVETLFGRRLYLPEINSSNGLRRKGAERAAINAPMQGTAADIIKRAMILIDNWIEQHERETVHMIMQVHDELVFEIKESEVHRVEPIIKNYMEQAAELDVPLIVSAGFGPNWREAH